MRTEFYDSRNKISEADFNALYFLMKSAFSKNEYRTKEEQKKLLNCKNYNILAVYGEALVGFIAFWEFDNFFYLEHFAVDEKQRGKGIGADILSGVVKASLKPLVLEVEPPEDEIKKRRIAFYEKSGFIFCDKKYFQPPLNRGDEPTPLFLMSTSSLNRTHFKEIKHILYKEVYKVEN